MVDLATNSLALLMVEDSAADAELVIDALQQDGGPVSWRRVENEADYLAALDAYLPDVILSDWTLPRFSGSAALAIAHKRCPEVPFLFVTGTMDEPRAIEALRQGANDYVYKNQLGALRTALARVLAEASEQRQNLRTQTDRQRLSDQQFYYRTLIESFVDALATIDSSGIITDVNKQMEALTACTRNEMIGAPLKNYFTDPDCAEAGIKLALRDKRITGYQLTTRGRDGENTAVSCNATTFYDRDRKWKCPGRC